jgi:hypothetical protein
MKEVRNGRKGKNFLLQSKFLTGGRVDLTQPQKFCLLVMILNPCVYCGVGSVVLMAILTQIYHRYSVIHYPQLGEFNGLRWNYLVILQYILSRKYKPVALEKTA